MDIQTLLNNLHEEVSCSVCMCKYTDPKQLPCLHSFCLHCLNGIQRTNGRRDKIACPECRQEFNVPDNGNLAALPTNFRINSLLDVLAIRECNTTRVKCGNCDERTKQSHYCFQCCAFWCEECIGPHNRIKANKDHYALALEDFQDQDFENILKRPEFCAMPGHEKKEIEFFCNICKVAICNACALTNHDGHGKILLEQAANERKLRVKSAIESQRKRAQTKRSKITTLDKSLSEVQEQAARVKRNVQEYADSIIAAIEAKKLEIFDDVERRTNASLQEIENQKKQIEEQVKRHESETENTETLLKRSTSAQLMQPNELMDKILKEENNQENRSDSDDCSFQKFDFVKNHKLFELVSAEQIGSLKTRAQLSSADGKGINEAFVGLEAQLVVTTRNAEGQQYHDDCDSVTLEVSNRQGDNCAAEVQVKDFKDGSYKIKYFAKETGTCSASVKVNGEHIRGRPFEVQVKPRQFRPVLSFGEQILERPWGVAVNEQDEIAVSDVGNHKIHLFKSDGTHIKSFGGKGAQHGEFDFPSGTAYHGDNIIVSEQFNHRVQVLSRQGGYLRHFGGEGSLDHQFKFPFGLSINSDGNIIVADRNNKLIKIFSADGQFLHKLGTEGSFTRPFHCIQHDNYLIVSDSGDHSVKCFDRKGNFLYKFGKKGNAHGEFNTPYCFSMDKAGHLLVCDTVNHRIQVFDVSGKFVAKFGIKGSGIGEFNTPVSAAVLSDGKIVVSDFRNSRIQIFE
ncbi:E3 ubiquitin-protein ligase TRIM71-like [Porites lutea]|uniref:E3 ubiquitin-protein ligase TRIM71-like n=1 Tax=Porites lutea TaxID=51062 RepID=UPI003CC559DE